jgi:hypothetical protein
MSFTSSIQFSLIKAIGAAYGEKLSDDQVQRLLTIFGPVARLSAATFLLPLA